MSVAPVHEIFRKVCRETVPECFPFGGIFRTATVLMHGPGEVLSEPAAADSVKTLNSLPGETRQSSSHCGTLCNFYFWIPAKWVPVLQEKTQRMPELWQTNQINIQPRMRLLCMLINNSSSLVMC